ncbi:dihydrodipicolinate synthase family protein [Alteromonas oceanisediminis]|uniref:dihydrodipicolinate synthase family protein n=1 Tax=Alteromonas oceanisediminis TaxID=2836180 RepID=UPI002023A688|nr:dihydrodipicolinate synthase family protein [Alteromonas oceanisediminis]
MKGQQAPAKIREHLDHSGLDSIGVLGSTGSFAYLSEQQRIDVMACWSELKTPWIAGISATTTTGAVRLAHAAEKNGAQGVIVNAFSYVGLRDEEQRNYFLNIADSSPLPVCVYDNPVTTGLALSDELIHALSLHENIHAVKVFAQKDNRIQQERLGKLAIEPGYAVDARCCEAMISGGSAWYSTLAGTLPERVVPIMAAVKAGDFDRARELNRDNQPLYDAMRSHSGYRMMHALAKQRQWACELPAPLTLPADIPDLTPYLPKS